MKSSNGINGSPARRNNVDVDEDDNDSLEAPKTKQCPDDNVESSSTGSEGGKGGGSGGGGGYSADCSSSDASSDDAVKRSSVPEKEMKRLKVSGDKKEDKPNGKDSKISKGKSASSGIRSSSQAALQEDGSDLTNDPKTADEGFDIGRGMPVDAVWPQWNGIRIQHPMDPRIDLSTVDHIRTSSLSTYPHNAHPTSNQNQKEEQQVPDRISNQATPSIDQYMNLMEVVRPFFHAHGMSLLQSPASEDPGDRPSLELEIERSEDGGGGQVLATSAAEPHTDSRSLELAGPTGTGLATKEINDGSNESDCSSMVVLARVKRKHLRNKSADDPANEGSNNSSHGGSNTSSTSSSDKRVRIQHPVFRGQEEGFNHEEEPPRIENARQDNDNYADNDREILDDDIAERQESASASSSESRNNAEAPQNAIGFGVPAVVSEYSSSRTGSSGASNTHQMSTSGSGSAGNTGSGTGSGSNQGGSSGSGNDQGGISSNGNGSSASGNDVKGSSEEMMDNSAENNSGEGNSDATNSNNETKGNVAIIGVADTSHPPGHRHYPNMSDPIQHDLDSPAQSNILSNKINSNAVRERKLQDKKRKRQIMRREYEEKVQQEMESSEGSREREESALIKPGRPVTLDKVLSFTKDPRIVVSATPPFLVIHTNAAYCRLSGIDSHAVVGKPISNLLTMPDLQTLAEVSQVHQHHEEKYEETPGLDSAAGVLLENYDSNLDFHDSLFQTESRERQGLTAAEAPGRARAAASQEDSVERLIATSGFGRWGIINLNAKPLLGQNFSILTSPGTLQSKSREEGSNGSSITSNCDGTYRNITCSIGVSPVVSSPEAFAVVTDKDQESHHHKPKRRKHHQSDPPNQTSPHHQQPRRNFLHREVSIHRKRHLITHYVIQLEPLEGGTRKLGSLESQSSTSTTVEAQMLGVTKSELRLQRGRGLAESASRMVGNEPALEESDDDVMDSESSNPHEAVTAVG